MAAVKGSITITLTSWQKRMVKDYLNLKPINGKLIISMIIDKRHWVTYRIPNEPGLRNWNLYLTEQQITRIRKAYNIKDDISAVNINEALMKEGQIKFA